MRLFFLFSLPAFAGPSLPLYFEPNHGQFRAPIQFHAAGLALSPSEAWLQSPAVKLQFVHANPAARMSGAEKLPSHSNYFLGPESHTQIPHFARVRVDDLYPGVSLVYYTQNNQLEFDLLLAPHANPAPIRLRFEGATPKLAPNGDLILNAIRLHAPISYQTHNGRRTPIKSRFHLHPNHTVTFHLGPYDHTQPLTLDPVLAYSTFLESNNSIGAGIAVDSSGNTYITGNTANGFLTVNALQPNFATGRAAFVAKFNPAGTNLIYATYLAGSTTAAGNAPTTVALRIAVDRAGAAYIVGSTDTINFPVTPGTAQPLNKGADDLFVAKLNPTGTALVYATYLGGSGNESAQAGIPGIAVDPAGNAYISGGTNSRNFPVTQGALQPAYAGGGADAFVTKLDPLGSTIVYSTYLGSPGTDAANALAIDASGNAYITGVTDSAGFLKTSAAFQTTYGGGENDAFLAKLNPTGTALAYATLLGGSGGDAPFGLAVDAAGNAYVAGVTASPNFPTTAQAFQKPAGGGDAFVTKFNPTGTALVYSTCLGGTKDDLAYSIALDNAGNAIVAGGTESPDFPVTADAFQSGLGLIRRGAGRLAAAAFLTKLNPAGTTLTYSTFFGGSSNEAATAVALDAQGNALLTGVASSINFPRTTATYEPPDRTALGSAFLAKFDLASKSSMSLGSVVSAASYQTGTTGVIAPGQIVVLFGNEIGPAQLTTLQLNSAGRVDTALAGVRVFFDNIPAPLLYVSAKQLSAVVPYGVPQNGRTVVQVDYQGQRSNPLVLWVAPAIVGIFTQNSSGRGPAAVLNQDGTINSPSSPAEKGSIVVLYATGEGRTNPEGVDGKVTTEPLPRPLLRIFAQVDNRNAEILYVGSAPGLVAGVLQMNIRIPDAARSGPDIPLSIGGMDGPFGVEPSERVTIAIK